MNNDKKKGKATEFDKDLGQKIRKRRRHAGMSQEKMAILLGVTFQQIQKYENGSNRVSAARLWDLSIALGCSIQDLYPGVNDELPPKSELIDGSMVEDLVRIGDDLASLVKTIKKAKKVAA
jgi:transcriptional regulator with XRE-family HTH domain